MARKATTRKAAAPASVRVATTDGLQNILTGLGTEKDKLFNTTFVMRLLDRGQLDAAYRTDWLARKGIDIPAFDSTREWRTWQADPEDVTKIEDVENKFFVQLKVMRAMILGRLYGGGALVMGVDQGKPEEPLEIDKVGEGALTFLHCVSRHDLSTGEIEWDITSPWYGRPKYYEPVQRNSTMMPLGVKMHPSRVIPFIGNEIPDPGVDNGWGDSVLMSLHEPIMSAGMVNSSAAQMVGEAKLDVIKIPGLSQNLINAEYEALLKKRFSFANIAKSVFGIILLDAAEEWERIDTQFAGLPDIQKMSLLVASGAFDIPATRFLSQSPAGLSSTGESDTRNYYDRLSTEQNVFLSPALRPLDQVLLRSAMGFVPEDEARDMWYDWNPLWQQTEKEKAETAKAKADTFKIDVDAGLINEVVLKKAREAQLIADNTYPGLQQIIDEFDDDPEMEQANAEAAAAHAAISGQPITDPNDPNYDPTRDPNSPDFVKPAQVPNAPPKQLAPPKKAQPKAKASAKASSNAAVDAIRQRIADATRPRTLYVRRDLLNVGDLAKWARKQGFKSVVSDPHVTLIYSKSPVDWIKVGADEFRSEPDGGLIVKPGGPRVMEKFGKAVVMCFANSDLQYRHRSMMYRGEEDGISWDYEDYTPHVTISYDAGALDVEQIQPYTGVLKFGPEIFEEVKVGEYEATEEVLDEHTLRDALAAMPAPQVHVDVHVPPAPEAQTRKSRKKTVTVTKRDERGRPEQMVTEEDE